jgi:hypothetical protein
MLTLPRHDRQTPLGGIVDADEMYVLDSQKGARSLDRPARKRGGHASKRGISNALRLALGDRLSAGR